MATRTETGRIIAYDALRIFAIVTVVAIHTLMPYRDLLPDGAPVRIFDDLLHYAVPLFVLISGALVWGRPWPAEPGAYRRFVSKRAAVIGAPYLAWAALFGSIYVVRAAETAPALMRLPGLIATGHVWYHLYFIPMLLTFYLLTPVASRLAGRSPELLVVACYAVRFGLGGPIAEAFRAGLGDLGWAYATHVVIHLPHMALGAWWAMRAGALPGWAWRLLPAPLTLGGLAALLAYYAEWLPAMPPMASRVYFAAAMAVTVIGMTAVAFALEPRYERWSSPITKAGALAFGVYFVHPLVLLPLFEGLKSAGAEGLWLNWWFWPPAFAAVTAASFAIARMLARAPATAWLVGLPAPRRAG